jgi:hypothetical protein
VAAVRRLVLDALSPEEFDTLGDLAERINKHLDETAP